jgi:hypothetical protein
MKKTYFFSLWLLLSMPAVYAGQALKVHESGISQPHDYPLEEIRRITFADGKLLVLTTDETGIPQEHTLQEIRKITFGEHVRTIGDGEETALSENGADEQAVVAYITPAGELVVTSEAEMLSLTLYDMSGKMLTHVSPNGTAATLSLSEAPAGVYLLQIITQQGATVKKIIKQ